MKNVFLLILIIYSIPTFALQTTLTSSIYANEDLSNYYVSQNITNIPTTIRRVRFINRIDTFPEIEEALVSAEYIFSHAMYSENIDLVPISAEVLLGNAEDFDYEEVCKVSVLYTDNMIQNPYYNKFSMYSNNNIPVLIPQTIYNQCSGSSQGSSMQIILNPNVSYHYAKSLAPSDKYDAITIFLRALAIGCGIQSTLEPTSVQFGKTQAGQTYISAFDTKIYNDLNATYYDVVQGNVSAANFLGNRTIFAYADWDRFDLDEQPITLFNDWEYGVLGFNVTKNTLNTISPFGYTEEEVEDGFFDVLDTYLNYGMSQREVTPYTMALLRSIGWTRTTPVGLGNDYSELYSSELCCSNTTLRPNQNYNVWLTNNMDMSNIVCKLQGKDSLYSVGSSNGWSTFSYNSIPENVQWKRNPVTKNIVGQIQAKACAYIDNNILEIDKFLDIEIPYKPNKPLIHKIEETTNGSISLDLKAFANGSNAYTITYTGVTYNDTHTFTTTANTLDTILHNIPANQLYNLSIYGTNNEGNSDSYNLTFGFSAHPILNMTISINGNILKYDLSNNGTIDVSEVVISSVLVTDQMGGIKLTSSAHSCEPINISSLSRGIYILTVIADGNTYSRLFIKR